jgi:hypothetical protein
MAHIRQPAIESLPWRRPDGIFVAPFEQGEVGPDYFVPRAGWV